MNTIVLSSAKKRGVEFEPLPIPDVDGEDLIDVLTAAEGAHMRFRNMLELVKKADAVTDGLVLGTWLYDFMIGEDAVEGYGDCAADVVCRLKQHLEARVAQYALFCNQLDAELSSMFGR